MLLKWQLDTKERKMLENIVSKNILKWTFSTPLASHHNGAVESLIESIKSSLNKVVKDRVLSEEEYRTVMSEIQSSINSRPLWPPNDGDLNQPPITCNDLLSPNGLVREVDALNVNNPRTRYGYIQLIVDEWWKIWMSNFVPNLQIRNKWYKCLRNVQVGDIVLIIEPKINRSKWLLAKVIDTYKGTDGNVRSVKIMTSTGTYDRPITKLSLLIAKEEYENE